MKATIHAYGAAPTSLSTVEELDRVLDQLAEARARERPVAVTIVSEAGDSLTFGLGGDETVMNYVGGSLAPPYLASVGDRTRQGVYEYEFAGEPTELPLSQAIPTRLAREAARHFAATGQLWTGIEWVEV